MVIKLPRVVGQTTDFEAHGVTFRVKRLSRAEFSLWKVGERHSNFAGSPRLRFGDAGRILEDVRQILETGKLPASKAHQIY